MQRAVGSLLLVLIFGCFALAQEKPEEKPAAETTPPSRTELALDWLARHQEEDGRWSAASFTRRCDGDRCAGVGSGLHDVGLTGLALLPFLGFGETHQEGRFKGNVKAALKYLKGKQDSDGCFGPRLDKRFLYDHVLATTAMCEAYGMTGSRLFKGAAQRGIDFLQERQRKDGGWGHDGRSDVSLTAEAVLALVTARLGELEFDAKSLERALAWMETVTEPSGFAGYTKPGERSSRLGDAATEFPPKKSETTTALAAVVHAFAPADPATVAKDKMLKKMVQRIAKSPPGKRGAATDFYGLHHATMAVFQVGGKPWEKWSKGIGKVAKTQRDKGCAGGSFDGVGPWGDTGGRILSTAYVALVLEATYRYGRRTDEK